MPTYLAKPVSPRWQPTRAPAGCKLYLPLAEGAGATARDHAGSRHGSFVGSPSWQRGPFGPQLGGFTTGNYASVPAPNQILGSIYPFWVASLAVNTATATGGAVTIGQGRSSSANPLVWISYNHSSVNNLLYGVRDDAGVQAFSSATGLTAINDGLPHVVMGASYAANDHRLYLDGRQVATSTTNLGAMTLDTLTLGVIQRTSVAFPFQGSLIWAGMGNGSVPDPLALAADLLSGRFSAVRPRSSLALLAAAAGGTPPAAFQSGWAAHSNQFIGGGC